MGLARNGAATAVEAGLGSNGSSLERGVAIASPASSFINRKSRMGSETKS